MEEKSASLKKIARVAGLTYLVTTAIIVYVNFGINAKLMVESDAAQTARNILAHEQLFRLSILCHMIYSVGVLVLLTGLYIILKPIDRTLALLAAFSRLIYALMWIFIVMNFFIALRFIVRADYLQVFPADHLQALARVYLSGFDAYYVGLLFWALASAICSYLWFKSRYVPRALAAFGIISSIWCTACAIIFIINPDFEKTVNAWWFDSFMAIFEIAISFWLLFKGIRVPKMEV